MQSKLGQDPKYDTLWSWDTSCKEPDTQEVQKDMYQIWTFLVPNGKSRDKKTPKFKYGILLETMRYTLNG